VPNFVKLFHPAVSRDIIETVRDEFKGINGPEENGSGRSSVMAASFYYIFD
jgi:hypothetical protein